MWVLAALFVGAVIGVNYLEKHKKENAGMNKAGMPVSNEIGKTKSTDEKKPQTEKGIYQDPMAVQLAEACKCGDASAMYKMAELVYRYCEAQMKKFLERYEANPTPKHAESVQKNRTLMGEAYMMWLVRAALYGDAEAGEKLDKCPIYKELAFIPYDMMSGEKDPRISFWNSGTLHDIGFIDVPEGCTDCRLLYDADKKIFDLFYVSDYEPPDEDGFGAEYDYDDIYFDEFFRRLPKEAGNHQDSEG